jgi:hypothetical protein
MTRIVVAVRARPLNSREKNMRSAVCVSMEGGATTIMDGKGGKKTFTYDQSYWWDSEQNKVYQDLGKGNIAKAIEGFNGTVFAYGQTGSGKTYSMMGYEGDGIIPRLNTDLMAAVAQCKKDDPANEFLVTVSYLEIYNEVIKDLLNPSDKHLKIREHPDMGIYVEGLAELVVGGASDITELIEQGNKVRSVAATQMNARSSRSHSCFTIKVSQRKKEDMGNGQERTTKLNSKLNLVDLAGSERQGKTQASGQQLKEGAAINKSLSALGNVINALSKAGSKKDRHIPYRDSKLTRLLQESLGGNSRTVMIATISPAQDNYEETLSTLQYASRAKKIENKAKRNEDVSQKVIRQLKEEIEKLRAELAAAAEGRGSASKGAGHDQFDEDGIDSVEMQQMEEKIANLERAKKQSWEEKQKLSRLFQQEREKNLKNENYVRDVMQTVKQENVDLIRRLRALQREKNELTGQFKKKKAAYHQDKKIFEQDMLEYSRVMKEGAESGVTDEDKLAALLVSIETKRQTLVTERDELERIKRDLHENEERQTEERAEMAAHKTVLQQDQKLRSQIAEEERQKFLEEKQSYLDEVLKRERARLQEQAANEVAELKKQFRRGTGISSREKELEMQVVQDNADREVLMLELQALKKRHKSTIRDSSTKFDGWVAAHKGETQKMITEMVEAFEEELSAARKRSERAESLLADATRDLEYLMEENEHLRMQLNHK